MVMVREVMKHGNTGLTNNGWQGQELNRATRDAKGSSSNKHIHKFTELMAMDLAVKRVERREEIRLSHGPVKQLVVGGRWNVPPGERPKGWERMGVQEPGE